MPLKAKTVVQQKRSLRDVKSTPYKSKFEKMLRWFPDRPSIISEGDSWFDYPKGNIVDVIEQSKSPKFNILRLENNGDEMMELMSGKQKHGIASLLKRFSNKVDILLYSGGGNDIVGPWDMEFFLKQKTAGMGWQQCIQKQRFNRKLLQIKTAWLDLLALRDDHSPQTIVITHGYDYPIPRDEGFTLLNFRITGPWMYPAMKQKGIDDPDDQRQIARWMIGSLGELMKELAADPKYREGFRVADTAGTVADNEWADEIHPNKAGFEKVAARVMAEINAVL